MKTASKVTLNLGYIIGLALAGYTSYAHIQDIKKPCLDYNIAEKRYTEVLRCSKMQHALYKVDSNTDRAFYIAHLHKKLSKLCSLINDPVSSDIFKATSQLWLMIYSQTSTNKVSDNTIYNFSDFVHWYITNGYQALIPLSK